MTPISNVYVPDDIMKAIILRTTDGISHLGQYRTVCKDFKRITEDKEFLQRLLVQMKGEHFADAVYSSDPQKFLAFDSEIIRFLKNLIQNAGVSDSRLTDISLIALKNLKLGTIYLHHNCICHGKGFRVFNCSRAQIENLKHANFEKCNEWQACLSNIADSIVKFDQATETQAMYPYISGSFCPEKAKAAIDNPDEKIKNMIVYFGISDTSLVQSDIPENLFKFVKKVYRIKENFPISKLVINSAYRISFIAMTAAFCTRQEFVLFLRNNLYREIVRNLALAKSENGAMRFHLKPDLRHSLLYLFKDNEVRLTELINQENFNSSDNSSNELYCNVLLKVMMGLLFPDILQNLLNQQSNAFKMFFINSWMLKIYASIKEGVNFAHIAPIHNIMVERFKDPISGLKAYIEHNMRKVEPVEIVSLPWKEWFPEVWPKEPQDQAKAIQDTNSASSDKG
jgi:hypothetical protein